VTQDDASVLASGSPVRRWLPWALLAVVVVTCLSVAAFGSLQAPTAQDRVTTIARTIKCPQCSSESAAESNTPAAQEIRAQIAEQVQQGRTDDEIRASFVGSYDGVLLTTPSSGINVLVWIIPVVALALAIGFLVVVFRRWSQEPIVHATAADEALVAQALRQEHERAAHEADPHGEGSSR
jgi:cytochrome c-type biogenesis protein CcmH